MNYSCIGTQNELNGAMEIILAITELLIIIHRQDQGLPVDLGARRDNPSGTVPLIILSAAVVVVSDFVAVLICWARLCNSP